MGPVLDALKRLQSIENRLGVAKAKLTRCRRNVVLQENQVRNLQNTLEAKKEELQLTKVQADRMELELKSRDEIIAKSRASLNLARTNKEYAAILTELNTNRAENSKLENQALELMKDIETDEAECSQIQAQIDQQKQQLDQIRTESKELAEKYQAEIDDIQAEWDNQAKAVSPDSLKIFKRVAETYDGEALAKIEQQNDGSGVYSCGGCFMGITAESVNLLMTKDEIIRCPDCTRILILDESRD